MADHLLSVPIPDELYDRLIRRSELTGLSPQDLLIQALACFLEPKQLEPAVSAYLEIRLQAIKQELRQYLQQQLAHQASRPAPEEEIPPSIRPLQIGDTVQIRDPDSPFYLQKAVIVSTSLIRATVDTGMGKHTFLKRDIRFVSTAHDST
jgi:hypothetical protein